MAVGSPAFPAGRPDDADNQGGQGGDRKGMGIRRQLLLAARIAPQGCCTKGHAVHPAADLVHGQPPGGWHAFGPLLQQLGGHASRQPYPEQRDLDVRLPSGPERPTHGLGRVSDSDCSHPHSESRRGQVPGVPLQEFLADIVERGEALHDRLPGSSGEACANETRSSHARFRHQVSRGAQRPFHHPGPDKGRDREQPPMELHGLRKNELQRTGILDWPDQRALQAVMQRQ